MTTAIVAKDRTEAREVARHLKMLEWRFIMDAKQAASIAGRSVIVLAPSAAQHEEYRQIINVLRARDCHLFEVDAWRQKFMTIALFTKSTRVGDEYLHEERELYVRDEGEAHALDGKDGWVLVTWGQGPEVFC